MKVHPNPYAAFINRNFLGELSTRVPSSNLLIHGGGASGLTLGSFLKHAGVPSFQIVEPKRPGGVLKTVEAAHGMREWAANGYLSGSVAMDQLLELLKLTPIRAQPGAKKRYVVRRGRCVALPTSPWEFFWEPFLGYRSKLELVPRLMKFFCFGNVHPEESLFTVVKKAAGQEAAETLSQVMVAGIYGGRSEDIPVGLGFPRLLAMLDRSNKTPQKKKPARPELMSFRHGMEQWVTAMVAYLGDHLVQAPAARMQLPTTHIVTVPAHRLSEVLPVSLEDVATDALVVRYAPIVSVQVFAKKSALPGRPSGFGILVPPGEKSRLLGVLNNDCIFEARTHDPQMLSMNFLLGGTRDPSVLQFSDHQLLNLVNEECRRLFGPVGAFEEVDIKRWENAIPQYDHRLARFWERAHRRLTEHNLQHDDQWIIFGNYTGQVALRGIVDGASLLATELQSVAQKGMYGENQNDLSSRTPG